MNNKSRLQAGELVVRIARAGDRRYSTARKRVCDPSPL